MLRIYPVCLEMVRGVRPCVEKIGRFDADLARQLRKASTSVALNVAEGSGSRGGKRRHCYDIALGEARETLANLVVATAVGYMPVVDAGLRRQLNQIIGTLVNIIR
jgi:four helix bundle protein